MSRCIVSVATGDRFVGCLRRLDRKLNEVGDTARRLYWVDELPPGTPPDPYAFKVTALEHARDDGCTALLWCDSSIVPLRSLEPIWQRIEQDGYWFSENWHDRVTGEWTADRSRHPMNSDWTCEEAYGKFMPGLTLADAKAKNAQVKHIVATAFGLNLSNFLGKTCLALLRWDLDQGAFQGPRETHRHDQTCLSLAAWCMSAKLTVPPAYFADGGHETSETILASYRGWVTES